MAGVMAILFDDKRSYLHYLLGAIALFCPKITLLFATYEIAEALVLWRFGNRIERRKDFPTTLGDFCEFALGTFTALLLIALSPHTYGNL